jgi:hypothetical protein
MVKNNSMSHTISYLVSLILLCISISSFANDETDLIDSESLKLINTKPLLELGNEGDTSHTHPSEALAIKFLKILEKQKLEQQVKECAAQEGFALVGESSGKCDNAGYEPDVRCLIKEGFWKGHLHSQLAMKSFDLNQDNIPDYIVTGNSCTGFAHNYTSDFFLFLSQKDKRYNLTLSISSSFISVVPKVNGIGYLILEGINSYNGDSVGIWSLEGNKYTESACFYRDHAEENPLFRKCIK